MKKFISVFLIFIAMSFALTAYTQTINEVAIGTMSKGKLTITNDQYLINYFNRSLKNNGTLGTYIPSYSPDYKIILLNCPVTDNTNGITCIGITLTVVNGTAYFLNENSALLDTGVGGNVEISCVGDPCNSCLPKVSSWYPFHAYCACYQNIPPCNSCHCNMTISTSINVTIGL